MAPCAQGLVEAAFAAGRRFFDSEIGEKTAARLPLDAGFRPYGVEVSRLGSRVNLDEASDGTEALGKLARVRYALIISDLFMEPMPGIELLMKMRRSESSARILFIMMTSRSQKKFMEVVRDADATHYLAKPFEAADLAAKIGRLDGGIRQPSQKAGLVSRPLLAGIIG